MATVIGDDPLWWEPSQWHLALVLALVATACWGSWSNTAKDAGGRVNFAHYYTDFCIGALLTAVLFALTLGAGVFGREQVDLSLCFYAFLAGGVFGVANLMLTTGVALAGLAIAVPLCLGTGLVGGTVLTYFVDRRGHPELIFLGVLFAFLGVLANARAYAALERSRRRAGDDDNLEVELVAERSCPAPASSPSEGGDAAPATSVARNTTLCIIGGVFRSLWAPFAAKSRAGDEGLSPYFSFVCFTASSLAVAVLILAGQQYGISVMPRVGSVTSAREYVRLPVMLHGWGLLGGFIWAVGTLSNLVSGGPLGNAVAYALGQSAPVVAAFWGLTRYREFKGAPRESVVALVSMFALFLAAITLLCLGGS
mmetsp:Transcript_69576/g.201631  ORF Transcript_69576/g.201631 Transcript_69576/m.201631 type:complete len:368 (-) Transcript_69576:185-1288(-)